MPEIYRCSFMSLCRRKTLAPSRSTDSQAELIPLLLGLAPTALLLNLFLLEHFEEGGTWGRVEGPLVAAAVWAVFAVSLLEMAVVCNIYTQFSRGNLSAIEIASFTHFFTFSNQSIKSGCICNVGHQWCTPLCAHTIGKDTICMPF